MGCKRTKAAKQRTQVVGTVVYRQISRAQKGEGRGGKGRWAFSMLTNVRCTSNKVAFIWTLNTTLDILLLCSLKWLYHWANHKCMAWVEKEGGHYLGCNNTSSSETRLTRSIGHSHNKNWNLMAKTNLLLVWGLERERSSGYYYQVASCTTKERFVSHVTVHRTELFWLIKWVIL